MTFSSTSKKTQWRLGQVLPVGLGLVAVLTIATAVISFVSARSIAETESEVNRTNVIKSELNELEKVLVDAETGQRGFLYTGRESFLAPYERSLERYDEIMDDLRFQLQGTPEQLSNLEELQDRIDAKYEELGQTIALKQQGQEEQVREIVLSELGKDIMDDIREQLDRMKEIENNFLVERTEQAQQAQSLGQIITIGSSVVVIIAIGGILLFVRSDVVEPIERVASDITASSAQIASAVVEEERIANEQAAAVRETTVTIEQLGRSSLKTAEQAAASANSANEVLSLAKQGDRVVEATLEGMVQVKAKVEDMARQSLQLSDQTARIGRISNVVSELAAQTNMLALNAAVEAVRAGDRGKGFGVVASEIRQLADRSRSSADQINQLVDDINTAIQATLHSSTEGKQTVEEGMKSARSTAETFDRVAKSVQQVVDNSQQIAATVDQQNLAIQQIVTAMNDINQGASQTASSLTQTKAGAQQLNQAAQTLTALV